MQCGVRDDGRCVVRRMVLRYGTDRDIRTGRVRRGGESVQKPGYKVQSLR